MNSKEASGSSQAALLQTSRDSKAAKLAASAVILVTGAILALSLGRATADTPKPAAGGLITSAQPVTFSKNVAPILFENCVICHRPGQSAPFSLLTSADARKRARDIARV